MRNWIWQKAPQPRNWQQRFSKRKTLPTFSLNAPLEKPQLNTKGQQKQFLP